MQVWKFRVRDLVIIIILSILILFVNTHILISNDIIQEWFRFLLKLFVFILLIVLCLYRWSKLFVFSILGIIFVLCTFTPLAFITTFVLFDQLPGNGFREQIHLVSLDHKNLVVYQNNCGATCAYGIDVAIEKSYLFGMFKTVNFIEHYYPADDLIFERVGPTSVKIVKTNIDRTDRQLSETVPVEGDVWDLNNY